MDYTATIKYIRTSPRKLRLVADAVRALPIERALGALLHVPQAAARPLADAISSAVANAKAKQADVSGLTFKTLEIGGGPVMKRYREVSRGQAHGYKKRMSHIRVVLTDEHKSETVTKRVT
ncbi:50S ribosomal protein L22 [Candidatus Gottesmanbacteria bacterium]|nr:50S ribosomal protein L22 [Candidatus Gottesmanbacteria bacterium]